MATEPLQNIVLTLWRGDLPLWVAFWVYGQGVYAIILASYLAMYKISYDMLAGVRDHMAQMGGWVPKAIGVLGTFVNVADALGLALITLVWFVMVWRAAPNTDYVIFTYLARAFVVATAALLVLGAYVLYQTYRG
ncbi:MAG TPA: hypothetical protein VHP58_00300 [Alphaproteobacteria bacterium]|nr:hypothetical protein [Alphaproteobacteria bacterium]